MISKIGGTGIDAILTTETVSAATKVQATAKNIDNRADTQENATATLTRMAPALPPDTALEARRISHIEGQSEAVQNIRALDDIACTGGAWAKARNPVEATSIPIEVQVKIAPNISLKDKSVSFAPNIKKETPAITQEGNLQTSLVVPTCTFSLFRAKTGSGEIEALLKAASICPYTDLNQALKTLKKIENQMSVASPLGTTHKETLEKLQIYLRIIEHLNQLEPNNQERWRQLKNLADIEGKDHTNPELFLHFLYGYALSLQRIETKEPINFEFIQKLYASVGSRITNSRFPMTLRLPDCDAEYPQELLKITACALDFSCPEKKVEKAREILLHRSKKYAVGPKMGASTYFQAMLSVDNKNQLVLSHFICPSYIKKTELITNFCSCYYQSITGKNIEDDCDYILFRAFELCRLLYLLRPSIQSNRLVLFQVLLNHLVMEHGKYLALSGATLRNLLFADRTTFVVFLKSALQPLPAVHRDFSQLLKRNLTSGVFLEQENLYKSISWRDLHALENTQTTLIRGTLPSFGLPVEVLAITHHLPKLLTLCLQDPELRANKEKDPNYCLRLCHYACVYKSHNCLRVLLQNPTIKDAMGALSGTAEYGDLLLESAFLGKFGAILLLVEGCALPTEAPCNRKIYGCKSALLLAGKLNEEKIILTLLKKSAQIFVEDDLGNSLLSYCCLFGKLSVLKILANRENFIAHFIKPDSSGISPHSHAAACDRKEILNWFTELSATKMQELQATTESESHNTIAQFSYNKEQDAKKHKRRSHKDTSCTLV